MDLVALIALVHGQWPLAQLIIQLKLMIGYGAMVIRQWRTGRI